MTIKEILAVLVILACGITFDLPAGIIH